MKRILIFSLAYHPLIGGAEIAVKEITDRLGRDFLFDLITLRFDAKHPRTEKIGNVIVHRVGWGGTYLNKIFFPLLAANKGRQLHREKRLDASWAIMTYMLFPVVLMRLFGTRIPYLLTLQDGDPFERVFSRIFILPFRPLLRYGFRNARAVQVISSYLLGWAKRAGFQGVPEVIPNGVDVSRFGRKIAPEKRTSLRAKWNVKENDTLLVTVSRLVPKNGVADIIAALSELPEPVKFLVVGSGALEAELKGKAKKRDLVSRIFFAGEIPHRDVPDYLHAADIFIRPSHSEGMGSAFIEAMAAGLPVIGTSVGGIKDFLVDPSTSSGRVATGLVVEVSNPKSIAEAVGKLMHDQRLQLRLIESGRRMAAKYDWNDLAKHFHPLLHRVAAPMLPRILVATPLYPPDIGGPATYSKILKEELPKRGYTVSVLSFGSVRRLPKVLRHGAYFLLVLLRGIRADIIYAQDPVSVGFPAMLAAKILRRRFLLKIVGDYAWEQGTQRFGITESLDTFAKKYREYPFFVRLLKKIQQYTAHQAEKVIVPSNYLKQTMTSWGIAPSKVLVIYNSFKPPRPSGNRAMLRNLLSFQGRLIVSVGRLVPWKGFIELISVMPEIQEAFPDAKLMIIGEGPMQKVLEKEINDRHLEESVVLTGKLPHDVLMRYLEAADLFVLNTSYEGFSHQILEAMAVGVPVVTTRVGGNTELIESGVDGVLIPHNDKRALGNAMQNLLSEEATRERLKEGAKRKIQTFTAERMLTALTPLL